MLLLGLLVGLVIGVALGALGGGGSILAVPALVYLLGQSPQDATAGSLVVVGVAAASALPGQARAGRVRWARGLAFSGLGVAGAVVGSKLSAAVDPDALLLAFAALLLGAAGGLRRRRRRPASAPAVDRSAWRCRARTALAASAVGLLTGFFGVGGGFVVVPALVLVLGFELPVAIGTSLLVITANSAVALGARLGSRPDLDWPLLGLFAAAAVVGAAGGQRLALRTSADRLSTAFSWLLVVLAGAIAVHAGLALL